MQIVIEIDEARFNDIQRIAEVQIERNHFQTAEQIIANGTPLPKGHGRLIDADATLKKHCVDFCKEKPSCYEDCGIYDLFHLAPTIIEADKGDKE